MSNAKVATGPQFDPAPRSGARWTTAPILLLAVITLLGCVLRMLHLQQWSFGEVEAATYRALTQPMFTGEHGFVASQQSTYPLVFLLQRWLFDLGLLPGFSEGWVRLPYAFAGCLLVPLMAIWSEALAGRSVAFLTAVVLAIHPGHIAASQTADPIVFAVTLAVAAGVAANHSRRWLAFTLLVLAGGCHPIGWLGAIGMLCAARSDRQFANVPRLVWWLLCLHAVVLLPCFLNVVGLSLLALALLTLGMRSALHDLRNVTGLILAAMLPLLAGGIWWWFDARVGSAACLAALPATSVLAVWGVVHFASCMSVRWPRDRRAGDLLRRLVMVAPAVMLLGELATGSFLYSWIFQGARAPWRDVRTAVLASVTSNRSVEVLAGRGREVLRAYLRPSHWSKLDQASLVQRDPHPGLHVSALPATADLVRERLLSPDTVLVLCSDEWQTLQMMPGGAQLAQELRIVEVWPSPQLRGDSSLYLLRLRPGQ